MTEKYTNAGAIISSDEKYRYLLWREWRSATTPKENWRWFGEVDGAGHELGEPMSVVFVMLNPSTADGETDDPTIRRCVWFAKAWGFDRLEVVNLFAYRATNPKELLALEHHDDPVGHRNQHYVSTASHGAVGKVVCAWGAHGTHLGQDETVLGWLMTETYCLGRTKNGSPSHPLYLSRDAQLTRFRGTRR